MQKHQYHKSISQYNSILCQCQYGFSIQEGSTVETCSFLQVRLSRIDKTGEDHFLGYLEKGDYFGEVALVCNTPRMATAIAMERSVLLVLTRERFVKFCKRVPTVLAEFQAKLARYNCTLESIIHHQLGYQFFTKFLELNNVELTLEFVRRCMDFRNDFTKRTAAGNVPELPFDNSNPTIQSHGTDYTWLDDNEDAKQKKTYVVLNVRYDMLCGTSMHAFQIPRYGSNNKKTVLSSAFSSIPRLQKSFTQQS